MTRRASHRDVARALDQLETIWRPPPNQKLGPADPEWTGAERKTKQPHSTPALLREQATCVDALRRSHCASCTIPFHSHHHILCRRCRAWITAREAIEQTARALREVEK
jgi:hypothetical protein